MARPQETDFLQGFRFHVELFDNTSDVDFLQNVDPTDVHVGGKAGFQSVTLPELTNDAAEYREGIYKFTKKFPGVPTFGDITLQRGVVKTDTGFFDWVIAAVNGGEYRSNVRIMHYHRSDVEPGMDEAVPGNPSREYLCYNSFPIRVKPAGDLDSTATDISLTEMDIAIEYFEVKHT